MWTSSESLLLEEVDMPYNLNDVTFSQVSMYSQGNDSSLIFPEFTSMGDTNYFGTPYDILQTCIGFKSFLKQKKISLEDVYSERPFLAYFFPVVLSNVPEVKSVFFARPELNGETFTTLFRLNLNSDGQNISYIVVKATHKHETEKWTLYEFEVGAIQNERIE